MRAPLALRALHVHHGPAATRAGGARGRGRGQGRGEGRGGGRRALALGHGRRRCCLRFPALGRLGFGARGRRPPRPLADSARGGPGTLPPPGAACAGTPRGRPASDVRAGTPPPPPPPPPPGLRPGPLLHLPGRARPRDGRGLNMAAVCLDPTGCVPGALQTRLQGGSCSPLLHRRKRKFGEVEQLAQGHAELGLNPGIRLSRFQGCFFHHTNTASNSRRPEMVKNKNKYCCRVNPSPSAPFEPNLKVLKFDVFLPLNNPVKTGF